MKYHLFNGVQTRPVAESDIAGLIPSGTISTQMLVWKSGVSDWLPACRIPGWIPMFSSMPPASRISPSKDRSPVSGPVGEYNKSWLSLLMGIVAIPGSLIPVLGSIFSFPGIYDGVKSLGSRSHGVALTGLILSGIFHLPLYTLLYIHIFRHIGFLA
ncbi:MAG: DUF4339 domain-containing protein [Thermoguttaceae bacterium]|nr:DUF4339 domain-containing protein [Thermoguttaceae bacterium]